MTQTEEIDAIIDAACRTFHVSYTELRSKSRKPQYVNARLLASNALRELTNLSYPEIGRLLGLDHATCFYHVNGKPQDARRHRGMLDIGRRSGPPPWVARAIEQIRKHEMKEPPVWRLLHDLGEALGFRG